MADRALERAAAIAEHFEGKRLLAYHDPVGYPTQGYGHLLSREVWADLSQWPAIDDAQAMAWLEQDMQKAHLAVARLCPVPLTIGQEAAMIDFTFNCGSGNLQISGLRQCVIRGDMERAADQFGRWVFARGQKLPGLVRRRAAEREAFLT